MADEVLVLVRTRTDGKLWQAVHFDSAPAWVWRNATQSADHLMGHLILSVANAQSLPANPGEVTGGMLPGPSGEGVVKP